MAVSMVKKKLAPFGMVYYDNPIHVNGVPKKMYFPMITLHIIGKLKTMNILEKFLKLVRRKKVSDEPKLDGIVDGEEILPDNYPVNWDFLYVCDGKVVRSNIQGTVRTLKQDVQCTEVRNCEIGKRNLWDFAV